MNPRRKVRGAVRGDGAGGRPPPPIKPHAGAPPTPPYTPAPQHVQGAARPSPPPAPRTPPQGLNLFKELLAPYTAADYRELFEAGLSEADLNVQIRIT